MYLFTVIEEANFVICQLFVLFISNWLQTSNTHTHTIPWQSVSTTHKYLECNILIHQNGYMVTFPFRSTNPRGHHHISILAGQWQEAFWRLMFASMHATLTLPKFATIYPPYMKTNSFPRKLNYKNYCLWTRKLLITNHWNSSANCKATELQALSIGSLASAANVIKIIPIFSLHV